MSLKDGKVFGFVFKHQYEQEEKARQELGNILIDINKDRAFEVEAKKKAYADKVLRTIAKVRAWQEVERFLNGDRY